METTNQDSIGSALQSRIVGFIKRPQQVKEKPQPSNAGFIVATIAGNLAFLLIDVITAVTVGAFTNALYGVLVFAAGAGFMIAWEVVFGRPYNNNYQNWIAIGGIVMAIGATITLGIMSGIAVAYESFALVSLDSWMGWIDVGMLILLVTITSVHGGMFLVYRHIDDNYKRAHARATNHAFQKQLRDEIEDSKDTVRVAKELEKDVTAAEHAGDLEALAAAFREITGRDLPAEDQQAKPEPVQVAQPRPIPQRAYIPQPRPVLTKALSDQEVFEHLADHSGQSIDELKANLITYPTAQDAAAKLTGRLPYYCTPDRIERLWTIAKMESFPVMTEGDLVPLELRRNGNGHKPS
jgi:hypothetical protein